MTSLPNKLTKAAILQPHYLPWIGYFDMIDQVDHFILFDDVSYVKQEWKNRNQIRNIQKNSSIWLTVPINGQDKNGCILNRTRITSDPKWVKQHLNILQENYRACPFFNEAIEIISPTFSSPNTLLADLNIHLIKAFCEYLGIETKLTLSSSLKVNEAHKTMRLIELCKKVGADFFLANNAAGNFIQVNLFEKHNIELCFQNYQHPTYSQFANNKIYDFLSHLSIFDLVANHGPNSIDVIRSTRSKVVLS